MKLSEAVKRLRAKVDGYVTVQVEMTIYNDGRTAVRWRAYSDKLGRSGYGDTYENAEQKLITQEPVQDVEVDE